MQGHSCRVIEALAGSVKGVEFQAERIRRYPFFVKGFAGSAEPACELPFLYM
jgi:hypothetical protein